MKTCKRQFLVLFLLILGLLLTAAGCSSTGGRAVDSDVQSIYTATTLGRVQGLEQDGVSVYKGIPYAKPPVGSLRFLAPEPAEPWSDTLDCTEFGSSALQPTADDIPTPDEDCLNLNVWTSAQEGEKQPVYVFIHGGAYFQGSGAKSMYDCTNFAKDGVVGVTINYRLGALGFLGLEASKAEDGTTGNFGTLDQIQALKWVKENISAFGGDPENITVGGESAGSFSVSALIMSPLAKGLFNQAIMESGCILDASAVSPYSGGDASASAAVSGAFARSFGADDSLEGLNRLRQIDGHALTAMSQFNMDMTLPNALSFWPVNDGVVLPVDPQKALANGDYNPVRLLVGNNRDEGLIFIPDGLEAGDYAAYAYRILGAEAAEQALARWPVDAEHTASDRARQLLTLAGFRLGATTFADTLSQNGHPVYYYEFNYSTPDNPAAYHASELPLVFGNELDSLNLDKAGKQTAVDMHTAWVNFIKTGDPNQGTALASGVVWEPYTSQSKRVMMIDDQWSSNEMSQTDDLDFLRKTVYGK